jgi:hypothetical protein
MSPILTFRKFRLFQDVFFFEASFAADHDFAEGNLCRMGLNGMLFEVFLVHHAVELGGFCVVVYAIFSVCHVLSILDFRGKIPNLHDYLNKFNNII